jgi:hypothetical protein
MRGIRQKEGDVEIPVLIEPVVGNGYRASGSSPFPFTVEGSTEEEALRKLHDLIDARLAAGAQVVPLLVSSAEHPWAPFAGKLRNDPMLEAWKQAMADYRRQVEEDPDIP